MLGLESSDNLGEFARVERVQLFKPEEGDVVELYTTGGAAWTLLALLMTSA
jgi:hypothetical protein